MASTTPSTIPSTSRYLSDKQRKTIRGNWGKACAVCGQEYIPKAKKVDERLECAHLVSRTENEDWTVSIKFAASSSVPIDVFTRYHTGQLVLLRQFCYGDQTFSKLDVNRNFILRMLNSQH